MKNPYDPKRLHDGSFDKAGFVSSFQEQLDDPRPITPDLVVGGPVLGLAGGMIVAVLGALGWGWFFALTGRLESWPALVIGALIGLVVRFTGGQASNTTGMIASLCAAVGIGGGVLGILYQMEGSMEELPKMLSFMDFALIFIGFSLARSLTRKSQVITKDTGAGIQVLINRKKP